MQIFHTYSRSPGRANVIRGIVALSISCALSAQAASPWGTYERPFRADSPWNSRPVSPVFGSATIPLSDYFPAVLEGAFSTGVFLAKPDDAPMAVTGPADKPGVWDPDAEAFRTSISIPRWPAATLPASGGDGHADIVDTATGVIHSFWQLRKSGTGWQAVQYAWTPLNGRGWGDPAHYFQGARAAGVASLGGLIRKHEANDGDTMYRHALAMSLTYNGLASNPIYQYPATSSDFDAAKSNTGAIPMGTLLMLPASFSTQNIGHPALRKIAETLKHYGAYVVDRNHGTPFVVYVETGANIDLHKQADGRTGWNSGVGDDLQRIRASLRPVASAASWLDGDGKPFQGTPMLNMLSMRGPWIKLTGRAKGEFDTLRQALVFPPDAGPISMASDHANKFGRLSWGSPQSGQTYSLTVYGSTGATLRIRVKDCSANATGPGADTGPVNANASAELTWPASPCGAQVQVSNGEGEGATWVRGELIQLKAK